jgi:hypothetical protein
MQQSTLMQQKLVVVAVAALLLVGTWSLRGEASEVGTGDLTLRTTKIKTVTDDSVAPELIVLPACPAQVVAFSPTVVTCPAGNYCTIEVLVTSELSDVTPGFDSVRFYMTIDGSPVGVLPSTNLGVLSTAKTGQIETGTAVWMKHYVLPGNHSIELNSCVADTSPGGGATGFAGDRTAVMRVYTGS